MDSYFPSDHREQPGRMVLLEDALNLADALSGLSRIMSRYGCQLPYFRFEPESPFCAIVLQSAHCWL